MIVASHTAESMVPSSGREHGSPATATASLLAAPILLAAAVIATVVDDAAVAVGPLDRVAFWWLVVAPLILLTPGAAALTWQATGRRELASRLIAGLSLAIGLGFEVILALTVTQIGCTPVHDPLQAAAPMLPIAVAAGVAFGLAGIVGMVSVGVGGRGLVVALRTIVAAAIGLTLFGLAAIFVFAATFAGMSCAAPQ